MTNLELQLQEILVHARNTEKMVSTILAAVNTPAPPPVVDLGKVIDAINNIKVASPEVDFTKVLDAIAAIPAPSQVAPFDPKPILDAIAGIDTKIGPLLDTP